MPKYIELEDIEILDETEKAVKILMEDGEEVWIPWSVVEDNNEGFKEGYIGSISISEWWADKEGLEY